MTASYKTDYIIFESADEDDHPLKADPFMILKREVDEHLERLQTDFEKWKHLLENTNTAETADFSSLTQSIKSQRHRIKEGLKEMAEEVKKIRNNPTMYSHISQDNLSKREQYVQHNLRHISSIKENISCKKTREKVKRDKAEYLNSKKRSPRTFNDIEEQRETHRNVTNFRQDVQLIERQQDDILDDMTDVLKRLNIMGETIGDELEEQNEMLQGVEDDLDDAQDRLTRMTNKLETLLGHSDGKKIGLIVMLVIILCVMMYFMF